MELNHLRFGWSSAGHGRRVVWICGGTLGQGNCVRNAACFDASGTVTYDVDSQTISSDITWDEVACFPEPIPTDAENEFVSGEGVDLAEPGELD